MTQQQQDSTSITELVVAWLNGHRQHGNRLFQTVYTTLRRRAAAVARGVPGLSPTELLNEAYVKVSGYRGPAINDRHHFFALFAKAMRWHFIEHIRRLQARREAGVAVANTTVPDPANETLSARLHADLVRALEQLERDQLLDDTSVSLFLLKYSFGFTDQELGDLAGLSRKTVNKRLRRAAALLSTIMADYGPPGRDR